MVQRALMSDCRGAININKHRIVAPYAPLSPYCAVVFGRALFIFNATDEDHRIIVTRHSALMVIIKSVMRFAPRFRIVLK